MSTLAPFLIAAVGIIAACMTTGSWVPQAIQTIRTRSARDFAWSYLLLFGGGVFLWLVYGILRRDVALVGANGVTFVLVARIVMVKRQSERELSPPSAAESAAPETPRPPR